MEEHAPQNSPPQSRQWWRRRITVNIALHAILCGSEKQRFSSTNFCASRNAPVGRLFIGDPGMKDERDAVGFTTGNVPHLLSFHGLHKAWKATGSSWSDYLHRQSGRELCLLSSGSGVCPPPSWPCFDWPHAYSCYHDTAQGKEGCPYETTLESGSNSAPVVRIGKGEYSSSVDHGSRMAGSTLHLDYELSCKAPQHIWTHLNNRACEGEDI